MLKLRLNILKPLEMNPEYMREKDFTFICYNEELNSDEDGSYKVYNKYKEFFFNSPAKGSNINKIFENNGLSVSNYYSVSVSNHSEVTAKIMYAEMMKDPDVKVILPNNLKLKDELIKDEKIGIKTL